MKKLESLRHANRLDVLISENRVGGLEMVRVGR